MTTPSTQVTEGGNKEKWKMRFISKGVGCESRKEKKGGRWRNKVLFNGAGLAEWCDSEG